MKRYPLTFLLLLLVAISGYSQQKVPDHLTQPFLDWYFSIPGQNIEKSIQPGYQRSDLVALLNSIELQNLSVIDKTIYSQYASYFAPEQAPLSKDLTFFSSALNLLFWKPENGYSWISYKSSTFNFNLYPVLGLSFTAGESQDGAYSTFNRRNFQGFRLNGQIRDELSFYVNVVDHQASLNRAPNERRTSLPMYGYVKADKKAVDFNDVRVGVSFPFAYGTMTIGKDSHHWGTGTESVILSRQVSGYPFVQWQINLDDKFYYEMLYGELTYFVPQNGDGLTKRASLAAHRLLFRPTPNWRLGIFESIVYSGRGFEPVYHLPFMFLRGAEHFTGSPDNANLGFSIDWFPISNIHLGYQFLIDDVNTTKIGTEFERNKFANLAYFNWFGRVFHVPVINKLNVGYVTKNTYNHKNINNSYFHYQDPLGLPTTYEKVMLFNQTNIIFTEFLSFSYQYNKGFFNPSVFNLSPDAVTQSFNFEIHPLLNASLYYQFNLVDSDSFHQIGFTLN